MNDKTKKTCYSYIRFSSLKQMKGSSYKRQLENADKYIQDNNLVIDKTFQIEDIGVSGYKGYNSLKGNLRKFLDAIDEGKIEKDSILLIESLDRLSRDEVFKSLLLVNSITDYGIKVVTLSDGREYTKETQNDIGNLVYSMAIMARSFEESDIKSQRVKDSWIRKRENISNRKMTGKCPKWLELHENKKEWIKLDDRIEIIKNIFKIYLDGYGITKIMRELNQAGVSAWISKNGWQRSSIRRILTNRALIGEYQPHVLENRKRIPFGNPIKDYFPKVIEDGLFNAVQNKLKDHVIKGGRNNLVSNLFTGLIKCSKCGSSLHYVNKGSKGAYSGRYLVCSNAIKSLGCHYTSMKYGIFEKEFLTICSEIDIEQIVLEDQSKKKQINQLKDIIRGINEEISQLEIEKDRSIKLKGKLTNDVAIDDFAKIIDETYNKISQKKNMLLKEEEKLSKLILQREQTDQLQKDIRISLKVLDSLDEEKKKNARLKLRNELSEFIDSVQAIIIPKDQKYKNQDMLLTYIEQIESIPENSRNLITHFYLTLFQPIESDSVIDSILRGKLKGKQIREKLKNVKTNILPIQNSNFQIILIHFKSGRKQMFAFDNNELYKTTLLVEDQDGDGYLWIRGNLKARLSMVQTADFWFKHSTKGNLEV